MKKIVTILATAILITFAACGKKQAAANDYPAVAKEIREKMCGKMEQCSKEFLAKAPEAVRKMMEGKMSKEACLAAQATPSMQSKPDEYKEEDLVKARECAAAIESASCEDLKNNKVTACAGFKK
ncbi:MAG: hypothetical protein K8S54_04545 [Spirochaetia bacterium]|nr:hypothetical protein [Spirochaetia bacterium]